ncbi:TPA: hypothetical protein SL282_004956 [Pseudomonas aeruginosa]|uniref:hypothetical protein n=1 Tax=Pseudomonas aeruginosa TaxID=287 RepID=UPI000F535B53|nr:hypothetical protein [Pseudomonas aeruginosa]RPW10286.1 hypothetical protein IPC775_16150 [Pseudomonas aeruginosa]HEJ2990337.1 hypothetical protein [Pseudomonas aeruginosa]
MSNKNSLPTSEELTLIDTDTIESEANLPLMSDDHELSAQDTGEEEKNAEPTEEERILQDLEDDQAETDLEEFEDLQEELNSKVAEPSVSLTTKLKLKLTAGLFPVSEKSNYSDAIWHLKHGKNAFPKDGLK